MIAVCEAADCSETPHFIAQFQGAADDGVCVLLQAASITPIAAPESSLLEELNKQIKDVNGEISTVDTGMEELLRTKPEDWQQELAYLRQEKRQLREKEKQLREEKLLLLRKADT